jgi:predicted Co/Zn/Cd cation transporter (cation efflux family)
MDSIYNICSCACHFVKRTVYIVVTLVVELTCAFVADLARKARAAYTSLTNNNTLRLVMDTLGVIIAVVAVIMAMLVSLTVVAIIVTLLLLPDKRLDGVQGPYVIYSA